MIGEANQETLLNDALLRGGLLPWQERYLHRKLITLDRGETFTAKMNDNGLYDFQKGCIDWLSERRKSGKCYSLIELDTGCGKTRIIGEFLQTMPSGEFAVYVTPGGLVRQTLKELNLSGIKTCKKAESSKEFHTISLVDSSVIVVNAAISRTWLSILPRAWCIILDEAHRFNHNFVSTLSTNVSCSRFVFCTATPYGNTCTGRLAYDAHIEQHFVLLKKPSLMEELNMPLVHMNSLIMKAPSTNNLEYFLTALLTDHASLYILLAIQTTENRLSSTNARQDSSILQNMLERSLFYLTQVGPRRLNEVARRLSHPAFQINILKEIPNIANYPTIQSLLSDISKDIKPNKNARPVCDCCGLQEEEIQTLLIYQKRFLTITKTPLPTDLFASDQTFVRALLRFPSSAEACNYMEKIPHDMRHDIKLICVHSGLNAAQRANRVKKFCQAGISKNFIGLIRHCKTSKIPKTLWEYIFSFLADRTLLIFDARCGDVGYNLQCATHIISPVIPKTSRDAMQICGRSCRIRSAACPEHTVNFQCLPRWCTGENLIFQHVHYGLQNRFRKPIE